MNTCHCNAPLATRAEVRRGTCSCCYVAGFANGMPVKPTGTAEAVTTAMDLLRGREVVKVHCEPVNPADLSDDREIVFDKLPPTRFTAIIGTRATVYVGDAKYTFHKIRPGTYVEWNDGREFEITGVVAEESCSPS